MKKERQIYLTQQDLERLELIIESAGDSPYVQALDNELANSIAVPSAEIPPDVITMNSRVRFEDVATGQESVVTLAYPADADASSGRISILAPIGSALLGMSVGQLIEWSVPGVKNRNLRIKEVIYQPEKSGDFDL